MKKITFVIDLDRCIGCHGCQISCKMENGVGLGACRNEVKDIGPTGTYPDIQLYFLPAMCQHCDNPARTGAVKPRRPNSERPIPFMQNTHENTIKIT